MGVYKLVNFVIMGCNIKLNNSGQQWILSVMKKLVNRCYFVVLLFESSSGHAVYSELFIRLKTSLNLSIWISYSGSSFCSLSESSSLKVFFFSVLRQESSSADTNTLLEDLQPAACTRLPLLFPPSANHNFTAKCLCAR